LSLRLKDIDELISLQDRAIEALKQANTALSLALSALERARNEHGYPQKLDFYKQPQYQHSPFSAPYGGLLGGAWNGKDAWNNQSQ
jgi:hypothetical protein